MNKKKSKLPQKKPISKDKNDKTIKKLDLRNIQKNRASLNSNQEKKEKRNKANINKEIKKSKYNTISANSKGKEKSESKMNYKINKLNKNSKENSKTKNENLTNNSTKRKINNNKKEEKPSGNKKTKNNKANGPISINIREIDNNLNRLSFKINENKENFSTNVDTITTQEIQSNVNTTKNNDKIKSQFENNLNENTNGESNDEENISTIKKKDNRLGTVLTPIPQLVKKKGLNHAENNVKDIQNVIVLRRLQYNDYIKNLNKPKPKPKPKPKSPKPKPKSPKPKPKPPKPKPKPPKPKPKLPKPKIYKVYDNNKVHEIQKIYKGFQTRNVNQIINRLKVNLCVTELYCLILKETYIHAAKRISFQILKLYYHEPFTNFDNEIGFSDRIYMKLSDKYYNFYNFN